MLGDYLWDEETGLLSGSYDEAEVISKSEEVKKHIFREYPEVPSPLYSGVA
jgi:type I restriction enzyme, R subunit